MLPEARNILSLSRSSRRLISTTLAPPSTLMAPSFGCSSSSSSRWRTTCYTSRFPHGIQQLGHRSYHVSNIVSSSLDDLQLIVTKAAAKKISQLQESSNNKELRLRVSVEGGGCSGFQYKFSMEDSPPDEDEDIVIKKDGMEVVVDESSLELIKGSTIDYTQELIRSAFSVVNNPQSESACGCGSSFAIKNFEANPAID